MTQETNDNVFYSGNGTVGRENMTAPTGYFFQMPKRKWRGLTDEDIFELRRNGAHSVSDIDFRAIEAKLKEKNT